MPHFTLQVSPVGPIVTCFFAVSEPRRKAILAAGGQPPAAFQGLGLIDTGASCTSIDPSVITALNLTPTGRASVLTPSTGATLHETDQFDIALLIPADNLAPLFVSAMPVISSELLQAQGFHALIGRDVLQSCILTYNGSMNLFTLAY